MTTVFPIAATDFVFPDTWVQRMGGRPAYAYTLVAGALPTGLALNGATGHISGTVAGTVAPGVYNFTLRLTDGLGRTNDKAYSITVDNTSWRIDARSPNLLGLGKYCMPIPETDGELVALGWPSIAGAVDGDLWLMYEAGVQSGMINAYQLTPQNAPLDGRYMNGLPIVTGLLTKEAVEFVGNARDYFADATAAECDVGLDDFTVSILIRSGAAYPAPAAGVSELVAKITGAGVGWRVALDGTLLWVLMDDGVGGGGNVNMPFNAWDGAAHLITISVDRDGNVSYYVDGLATVTDACPASASLSNAGSLCVGSTAGLDDWFRGQVGWLYVCVGVAADRTGHDAMWAGLSSNKLGTPNTYARSGPLTCVIAGAVGQGATFAANMFPVAYAANASIGDNPSKLGVVCEDAITFEPIGSDNFYSNTNVVGCAKSQVDGPSGMYDGLRVTMAGAWGVSAAITPGGCAIVGASNVPWRLDLDYRRALVNTTARAGLYYQGSVGGPEFFTLVSDAASPADWTRGGGTCTPVNADQALFNVVTGAALNLDDCDFGEPAVVKNRTTAPLAWRRVGTAAAAATGAQTLSVTNVGNARYSPAKGRLRLRISDFAGPMFQAALVAGSPFGDGANNPRCGCADNLGQIWTVNYATNLATVWDAATKAIIGHYATGTGPFYACADNNGQVWVTNYDTNDVTIFNAATHAVIATPLTGGSHPEGCCADGNGQVWIANINLDTISVFSCATRALISNFGTGQNPASVACDGLNQAWVPCYTSNHIRIYNATTRALLDTVACATNPVEICADLLGQMWVCNRTSQDVKVYNATTHALLATIALGVRPYFIRADAYGRVWVSAAIAGRVFIFDAATRTLISTLTLVNAMGLCADGLGQMWAAQEGSTSVSVYTPATVPNLLTCGAAGAAGALTLDYAADLANAPMFPVAPQARLRLWDDVAALVSDLNCGALTTAEAELHIEWNAAAGTIAVRDAADVLVASRSGAAWVPEAGDVAPLYVGSDSTPANAARGNIILLDGYTS